MCIQQQVLLCKWEGEVVAQYLTSVELCSAGGVAMAMFSQAWEGHKVIIPNRAHSRYSQILKAHAKKIFQGWSIVCIII